MESPLFSVNKYVVAYRSAAAVVTESVQAIRTVASLGAEPIFLKRYAETLVAPHDANVRAAWFTGAAAGVSQAVPYLAFGTAFYASSRFVLSGEYTFKEVNLAMMAVIFASLSLGQASTFMPDISKAKAAAVDLFMLMDRKSEIDPLAVNQGKKPAAITGDILISDVSFVYPRRPDATVFEGMTINVRAGETVALVGASGSGKSTAVWLVERFYGRRACSIDVYASYVKLFADPQRGQVLIDGVDVKDLNVKWLREHIGTNQRCRVSK